MKRLLEKLSFRTSKTREKQLKSAAANAASISTQKKSQLFKSPTDFFSRVREKDRFASQAAQSFGAPFYSSMATLVKDYDIADLGRMRDQYLALTQNTMSMHHEVGQFNPVLAERFKIAKEHFLLPAKNKKTGKKAIGMVYPSPHIINFLYEEIFFVASDVAQKFYGGSSKLRVFNEEDNMVELKKLWQYIAEHNFSNLILKRKDDHFWRVVGEINNEIVPISQDEMNNHEAQAIIDAILIELGQNPGDPSPEIVSTLQVDLGTFGKKTFRITLMRQSKSFVYKGSFDFPRHINIRMLPDGEDLTDLEGLGYFEEAAALIHKGVSKGRGLVVFAGAPGMGKSTTIHSLLKKISEVDGKEVIAIERSVEYYLPNATQIALSDTASADEKNKQTLSSVIATSLTCYADAVSVGEVLSAEEMNAVINLASRGRLTYTTIHANDCQGVFNVLDKNGVERIHMANMGLIVHQKLLPKVCFGCNGEGMLRGKDACEYCRSQSYFSDKQCNECAKEISCPTCNGKKYYGKAPLPEIALINDINIATDDPFTKEGFQKMIDDKKIIYLPRSASLNKLYKLGMISKTVYDAEQGIDIKKLHEDVEKIKLEQCSS